MIELLFKGWTVYTLVMLAVFVLAITFGGE